MIQILCQRKVGWKFYFILWSPLLLLFGSDLI